MDQHLSQQRIIKGAHFRSLLNPTIPTGIVGQTDLGYSSRAGFEVPSRVFGVNPSLGGVSSNGICSARKHSAVSSGQADHPFHQIDPTNHFGDSMLNLQAGIHLEKKEILLIFVIEKLHRTR